MLLAILAVSLPSVARSQQWVPSESAPTTPCSASEICAEWKVSANEPNELQCCIPASAFPAPTFFDCPEATVLRDSSLIAPIGPESLWTDSATQDPAPSRHAVPEMPLIIDASYYAAEEIHQFDGRALHFWVDRSSLEQEVIYAFTTKAALRDAMQQGERSTPALIGARPDRTPSRNSRDAVLFFADADWGDASFFVPRGVPVDMSRTWWRGRISSMMQVGTIAHVTLYESPSFEGSTLTLTGPITQPSLRALGWDDRAQSIYVWP